MSDEIIHQRVDEFVERLQNDLGFAAPEMQAIHMQKRIKQLVYAVLDDLDLEHEDDYTGEEETEAILADPETMAAIVEAEAERDR